MNPLDLRGPEFLALYVLLLAGVALVRVLSRLRPVLPESYLTPYEVARLDGGASRAVDAAIVSLLRNGVLAIENERLVARGRPATNAHRLERAVYGAVRNGDDRAEAMDDVVIPALEALDHSLAEAGYLDRPSSLRRWLPVLLAVGLAVFGLAKIAVGISRHRPVVFLIMLVLATVVLAIRWGRSAGPTPGARERLASLQQSHIALKTTMEANWVSLTGADAALALGLFGGSGLAKQLQPYVHVLHPSTLAQPSARHFRLAWSGLDSSCNTCSSCGSSCGGGCGGGCGGCGA